MEAISIRPCRPEDCPAVLELWHCAGATPSITDTLEDVARVLSEPAAALLVAVYDDRIVGSVIGGLLGLAQRHRIPAGPVDGEVYQDREPPATMIRSSGLALTVPIRAMASRTMSRRGSRVVPLPLFSMV